MDKQRKAPPPQEEETHKQTLPEEAGASKHRGTPLKKDLLERVGHLEIETARLREELEKAQSALEEERDRLLRALAEERNLRNRASSEEVARLRSLKERVLLSFLPVLDDFDRALASQANDPDSLRQGVEMILRQLNEALASHGVREMTCVGQPFDPMRHEAVGILETDEVAEGTVSSVQARGFLLDDGLLRPARVVVARRPSDKEESEAT